jgi:hypothetical protein
MMAFLISEELIVLSTTIGWSMNSVVDIVSTLGRVVDISFHVKNASNVGKLS